MTSGSLITPTLSALAHTHILWDNGKGTAALWRINPTGEPSRKQFGPFAGWAARSVAAGPDGVVHLLWTGRDRIASLWSVTEDGQSQHVEFGPFAGWEAHALAVGPDNTRYLLWGGIDGTAILWSIRPEQAPEARNFGPYDGWSATALSVGPDNHIHLLWNCRDGQAGIWRWAGDGGMNSGMNSGMMSGMHAEADIESQIAYGPYDGWNAVAITGGSEGASRLLWRGQGGQASLWSLGDADYRGTDGAKQPQTVYGPFEGWTATAAAFGPDDSARILWRSDQGGMASLWRVEADGSCLHEEHGPYPDWVPVALAAGPEELLPPAAATM